MGFELIAAYPYRKPMFQSEWFAGMPESKRIDDSSYIAILQHKGARRVHQGKDYREHFIH